MNHHAKTTLSVVLAFLFGAAAATVALRLGPSPSANAPVIQPPVNVPVTAAPSDLTRHADPDAGFAFSYRGGDDGYVLEEIPPTDVVHSQFVKTFLLMRVADRQELMRSDVGREGPPTIAVQVYRNPNGFDAAAWVTAESVSNYQPGASAPIDTVVGGEHAVAYESDGLYRSDNAVVTHGGMVYVFSAAWVDARDRMRTDFSDILRSVEFE